MRNSSALLEELELLKTTFGGPAPDRKRALLDRLVSSWLRTARQVRRLHGTLCFLRAYPDDAAVLARVEAMLAAFERRIDLRRHRKALVGSGIAGTAMHSTFFAPAAVWLVKRWGDRVTVDWKQLERRAELEPYLERFGLFCETMGFDELTLPVREWVARMKGPEETDAAFLVRRFRALRMDPRLHEMLYDRLGLPLVLSPGPDTPARTRLKVEPARIHFQTAPLRLQRPSLDEELRRPPPSVRLASRSEARRLIRLARSMMVCMDRDLDAFSYASDEDVQLADCGEGLVFVFIGCTPDRRLMLEALYGYLVLKNGVAVGYGTVSSLFSSCEIAYNVAEAFRGGEGAHYFGRLLACAKRLFGADTFSLAPYQIGYDNPEAIRSGAWWFYQKLGFRSRDAGVLRVMRRELALMRVKPGYRSSAATLRELASEVVFFHEGSKRDDVLGLIDVGNVGLHVTRFIAERYGSDRERAERELAIEAGRLLDAPSWTRFSPGERLAWRRWSPLVCSLPGIVRWSAAERRSLAAVIRAKGGARESEFVARFDRHARLRRMIRGVAAKERKSS
jgi:hypothetical protein